MPNISVTGAEDFQREVLFAESANARIKGEVWDVVKAVSLETKKRIKLRMPVDYGDARGRWGEPNYTMLRPRYQGRSGGGIWREDRNALSITQGAGLEPYEYIARLNEGYSRQAPAGFIDVTVEEASDDMTNGLLSAVVRVFDE